MQSTHSQTGEKSSNIGLILLEQGKINASDADRILRTQKEFGLRFGDAAIKLGLVTQDDVMRAVSEQFDYISLSADSNIISPEVIAAYSNKYKELDDLRSLRSQLTLRWFSSNKSLVFTSASGVQGTSQVVANLAVMYTQVGEKTLIVDANMRAPRQHELFKLPNQHGLSDILANRKTTDVIQNVEGLKNLHVLTSGTTVPNPSELLTRTNFWSEIENAYDIILIDSPSALDSSDAQILSAYTGGVVAVVRQNYAKVRDLDELKKQMQIAGAEVVGVVINKFRVERK